MEPPSRYRRKLRVLVITMGSQRQEYISTMFTSNSMSPFFEPPTFTPGVPSRDLRNKYRFIMHAGESGILPVQEWDVIQNIGKTLYEQGNPNWLEECLQNVPVVQRLGWGKDSHYAIELWYRGKSINRGRSVLACALAHFKAMKKLVEGDYDIILEDNVRAVTHPLRKNDTSIQEEGICECADRIWCTLDSSLKWEQDHHRTCHLRYYGWLGSRPNLEFIISKFIPMTRYHPSTDPYDDISIFPFPISSDFSLDVKLSVEDLSIDDNLNSEENVSDEIPHEEPCASSESKIGYTKAGGTAPIWGAYAYWISSEAYRLMMQDIQMDVGSLLWKGKRMRFYTVKPIDKVIPRRVLYAFTPSHIYEKKGAMEWSRECIHVTTHPAFFRAPMLTSKIHKQYDPEFCKSTEFQMKSCHTGWDQLWLTNIETSVVDHRRKTGTWKSIQDIEEAN